MASCREFVDRSVRSEVVQRCSQLPSESLGDDLGCKYDMSVAGRQWIDQTFDVKTPGAPLLPTMVQRSDHLHFS